MNAHKAATREAYESQCVVCGTEPCEPCHFPVHRGMGGAKAGWSRDEWVPLCRRDHDLVDGRIGVSRHVEEQRRLAIEAIERTR